MSSADTNNIGIKLQAAGENLNTWGDPNLNNDLVVLSNISSATKSLTINGTYTVSESNYSTSNDTENAVWKLIAGTVAAAFNFIIPARSKRSILWNKAGSTATAKLAASTGFSLPNNGIALLSCDGIDVYNVSPTHCGTSTQASDSNAYALWGAVQTAIATAGLPSAAGTVLISGTDTTAGYVSSKVTTLTNGGLVRSTLNGGANEQNQFGLDFTNLAATTNVAAADRFAVYDNTALAMKYQTRANVVGKYGLILQTTQVTGFTAAAGNLYPCDTTSGSFTVTLPASATVGDVIGIAYGGASSLTLSPNGLKLNGSTSNLTLIDEQTLFITYHSAGRGWV